MQINDLTKTQIVLLCLLVTFVASIVTAITTVTLMEQAPEAVTQGITKVVRQTIEKARSPEEPLAVIEPTPPSSEEALSASIEKASNAFVEITTGADLEKNEKGTVMGTGIAVSPEGLIVSTYSFSADKEYFVYSSEVIYKAQVITSEDTYSVIKAELPVGDAVKVKPFQYVELSPSVSYKVGDEVLATIGNPPKAQSGIISAIEEEKTTPESQIDASNVKVIKLDMKFNSTYQSAVLINKKAEIIGLVKISGDSMLAYPASLIRNSLEGNKTGAY